MKLKLCVVCGLEDGAKVGVSRVTLLQYQLVHPTKMMDANRSDGEITICHMCKSGLVINAEIIIEVPQSSGTRDSHIAMVKSFIEIYIHDVWDGSKAPTYYQLCDALNAAGVRTITGSTWGYHNLVQLCSAMRIDRNKMMRDKYSMKSPHDEALIHIGGMPERQFGESSYIPSPDEMLRDVIDPMDTFEQRIEEAVTMVETVEAIAMIETIEEEEEGPAIYKDIRSLPAGMPGVDDVSAAL